LPRRPRHRTSAAGATRYTISFAPYQTVSHLILLVTYLTAFYLVLLVSADRNAKKRLVYALIALGAFEAFYGLVQYLAGWQQIFAYVKKYYVEDATGTYINRNHFAGFLEMTLPFTVALALRQAGKLRSAVERGEENARRLLSAGNCLLLFSCSSWPSPCSQRSSARTRAWELSPLSLRSWLCLLWPEVLPSPSALARQSRCCFSSRCRNAFLGGKRPCRPAF